MLIHFISLPTIWLKKYQANAGKDSDRQAKSMTEALGVELAGMQAVAENHNFETFNVRYIVSPKTSYRRIPPKSFSKMLVPSHVNLHQEINVVFRIKQ